MGYELIYLNLNRLGGCIGLGVLGNPHSILACGGAWYISQWLWGIRESVA